MKLELKNKALASFKDVLEVIIADLKEANEVLVPELVVVIKSIQEFTTDEKVKNIIGEILVVVNAAQSITPDVIQLLTDLEALLK
jgi:SpoU rRNA methylase family enzyme